MSAFLTSGGKNWTIYLYQMSINLWRHFDEWVLSLINSFSKRRMCRRDVCQVWGTHRHTTITDHKWSRKTKPVKTRRVLLGQSVIKNVRLIDALQESKASEKVHFYFFFILQDREECAQLEYLINHGRNVSYLHQRVVIKVDH